MTTEIIFKIRDNDFENIDTTKYTKIFINAKKDAKTTKLSLSRYQGDILYILSNKDLEDIYEYFQIPETKIQKDEMKTEHKVKKSKQGNLFGFIKKK
jgi:hypothetical protein